MKNPHENIGLVYTELCASYRAIDDFRAKFLAALPLVTGGVFVAKPPGEWAGVLSGIGFFGFVISLGLFFYELYGIRRCTWLIETGISLERELGLAGQFNYRPPGIAGFVNEPLAAGVIYPAVLAAWTYLLLQPLGEWIATLGAIVVFAVGFFVSLRYLLWLENSDRDNLKLPEKSGPTVIILSGQSEQSVSPAESGKTKPRR